MSDMKCPFCKKELKLIGEKSDSGYPLDIYVCSCSACPETVFSFGNTVMWNNLRVLYEKLNEKREKYELAEKELIRTRKALDVAVDALKRIKFRGEHSKYECCKVSGIIAQDTMNKITAPEQKQPTFVHNKIEFPEFNDNLLEEFDKQFFENGQDDDLTETALEKKD